MSDPWQAASRPGPERLKVLVRAPHRVIETSLSEMLERRGFDVAQALSDGPDVALVDLCYYQAPYPDPPAAVPALALIKKRDDDLPAILAAGYRGYLAYDAAPLHLFKALQSVAQGEWWVEREVMRELVAGPKALTLTQREHEVQMLLAEGLSNREIAARLGISVSTVKAHLSKLFVKFKVRSRLELVSVYRRKHRDGV